MTYAKQCQMGRDHAAHIMNETTQTGNMPALVQAIREAVKDDSGYGAGFLFAIGAVVLK